jgi:MFS family permease
MAMSYPSWLAIFTRHIDKGKEAFEWSMEMTFLGAGAGIAGAMGGILASLFGFKIIFIFVGIFTLISTGFLFLIRHNISPRDTHISHLTFPRSHYEDINL